MTEDAFKLAISTKGNKLWNPSILQSLWDCISIQGITCLLAAINSGTGKEFIEKNAIKV